MSQNSNITTPTPLRRDIMINVANDANHSGNKNRHSIEQKKSQKQKPRNKEKRTKGGNNILEDDISFKIEQQIKEGKKIKGNTRKNQISINHLLEFQSYRDLKEYRSNLSNSNKPRRYSNRSTSNHLRKHYYGMEFININYKFIVDHRKDYQAQKLDPNIPIEVKDILRIVVPKGNACPICLSDEPIAPRMITSCGHILCLTCLLSLLESELPKEKKRETLAVIEKYKECPLCTSIIRKAEVKPVLVSNVDERFEVPKINDDVVLTLMTRFHDKVTAWPKYVRDAGMNIDDFPWINNSDEIISQNQRIFKGNLGYLLDMYEFERQLILSNYEQEKLLYDLDRKFVDMALRNIDEDIKMWTEKFNEPSDAKTSGNNHSAEMTVSNTFFYYETGFNAPSVYVLSPLDVKVIKSSYNNDYTNLPSSIVAKVENIKYVELDYETSTTKYKYLSHFPIGTSIGFLECNWAGNEFITPETWHQFKDDLTKRTKTSSKKLRKEENDKRRALNQEEIRTRKFFERENSNRRDSDDEYEYDYSRMGSLSIVDHRELPALNQPQAIVNESASDSSTGDYQTTIWGTKIPKAEAQEDSDVDWDAEEMIKRAKEEMMKQDDQTSGKKSNKKKKKKLILLSSNSTW